MKKRKLKHLAELFILLCITVFFVSCRNDDNGESTTNPDGDYLRAKIDGKPIAFKFLKCYQNTQQSITVTGGTGNIEQGEENTHIQLAIISAKNIETGTYELETTPTMVVTYGTAKPQNDGSIEQDNYTASTNSANPGDVFEIHIESFSGTHVTGTFGGIVVQEGKTVVISAGRFSLPVD